MQREDIEQKIKISVDTNANEASKDVDKLNASIDKTNESQESIVKENKKVDDSFKSLKVQLREATLEQQKLSAQYGSTSKEAIKATKEVAKLKDEIGFQKDLVKSYNPDEKFRGLSQTAGIAAIALSGVSEGFKALGIESKTLDRIIGTAQAILGVTSAVAAMSDAYAILSASKKAKVAVDIVEAGTTEAVAVAEVKATAATWSWNAALLANPIVLIIAGIIAAGAAIYAFTKITSNATSEAEKAKLVSMQLSVAIDNQAKSFENNNNYLSKNNDHKIALLRASGASEKQIYAETKALADQELQLAKNYKAEALILEQKAYERNRDKPTEFTAKALKEAQDNLIKAEKAVSVGYDGLIALQNNYEVASLQSQTDAAKKDADDAKAARKEKYDSEVAHIEKMNALRNALLEADKKRIEEGKKAILEIEQSEVDDETNKLNAINDVLKAHRERTEEETMAWNEKMALIELDHLGATEDEIQAVKDFYYKQRSEKEAEDDKIVSETKETQYKTNLSNLQTILALGGKKLAAISKGLAIMDIVRSARKSITETISNTGIANAKAAAASPLTGGMPFVGINTASAALSIGATIASSAMSIKSILGDSKSMSGGSGVSNSGGSGGGASATPQVNFQGSKENQIGNTMAGKINEQAPIRVTVLENDITKVQAGVQAKVVSNSF